MLHRACTVEWGPLAPQGLHRYLGGSDLGGDRLEVRAISRVSVSSAVSFGAAEPHMSASPADSSGRASPADLARVAQLSPSSAALRERGAWAAPPEPAPEADEAAQAGGTQFVAGGTQFVVAVRGVEPSGRRPGEARGMRTPSLYRSRVSSQAPLELRSEGCACESLWWQRRRCFSCSPPAATPASWPKRAASSQHATFLTWRLPNMPPS